MKSPALLHLGIKLGGTAFATPPYKNSKVFLFEIIMPKRTSCQSAQSTPPNP